MTLKELRQKTWEAGLTANMNQRYHQRLMTYYRRWDSSVRITVGILAVTSLVFTVVASVVDTYLYASLSISTAALSALFAVALNVASFGESSAKYRGLFERWTDLHQWIEDADLRIDECGFGDSDDVPDYLVDQFRSIVARINQIEACEPAPNAKLLNQCSEDAFQSRAGEPHTFVCQGPTGHKKTEAVPTG